MQQKMNRNKTLIIVAIIILLLIVGGLYFYMKGSKKGERQGIVVDTSKTEISSAESSEEYASLDSSDQVITEIDESIEYIE